MVLWDMARHQSAACPWQQATRAVRSSPSETCSLRSVLALFGDRRVHIGIGVVLALAYRRRPARRRTRRAKETGSQGTVSLLCFLDGFGVSAATMTPMLRVFSPVVPCHARSDGVQDTNRGRAR